MPPPNLAAIIVFCGCFLRVTVAGFFAARWKRADLNSLEEPCRRNGCTLDDEIDGCGAPIDLTETSLKPS